MMDGRKQYHTSSYERKRLIFIGLAIVLLCLFLIGVYFLKQQARQFVPPAFEVNAVEGTLEEGGDFAYSTGQTQYGFTFGIGKNLYMKEDKTVTVLAANPESNAIYLQYQILDNVTKKILYQTGVLRPGEYVETLEPMSEIENKKYEITIQINAFEPETWYSAGKIEIEWLLQPWL